MISQKVKIRWQSKKLQIQGAQILRNEVYLQYAAVTKDAAQRRSWTFYEAINLVPLTPYHAEVDCLFHRELHIVHRSTIPNR